MHRYHSRTIGKAFANGAGWVNEDYNRLTDVEVTIHGSAAERAATWKEYPAQFSWTSCPSTRCSAMPNVQLVRAGFDGVVYGPIGYNGSLERAHMAK